MFKKLCGLFLLAITLVVSPALARTYYFNYAQQGGARVITNSASSKTQVQRSFPGCTITVYATGTTTIVPIFSDLGGTAKANPFTAGADGSFSFWTDSSSVDIKFSGPGITTSCGGAGQLPCISAFTWSGAQSTAGTSAVVDVTTYGAKCDGVTNDATAIQTAINAVEASGATLYFPPGVCIVNSELSVSTASNLKVFHLVGSGAKYGGNQDQGVTIRAGAAMRSVLAIKAGPHRIEEIRFDGNYLATYGVYFSGAINEGSAFSRLTEVHAYHALKDGFFWDNNAAISDNTLLDTLWAYNNGTIYATAPIRGQYQAGGVDTVWRTQTAAGTVSTTTGSNIITGSGTAFTTLGLRQGDFIRVGSTLLTADYMQVNTVDSNLQITCFGGSTATASVVGAEWAAFIGDGLHFSATGGQNGIMRVKGGLFRGNASAGIFSRSGYGHHISDAQLETSGFCGLVLGIADANTPTDSNTVVDKIYFEGNQVASIWLGHLRGSTILPSVTGDPSFIKTPPGVTYRAINGDGTLGPFPVLGTARWENAQFNMLGVVAHNGYAQSYFVFQLYNDGGGALKHRFICDTNTGDAARGAGKIKGQTASLTVTPAVGVGTGFAGGAGILGGDTILFDTADQATPGVSDFRQDIESSISIVSNGTGIPINADINFRQDNINGVTIWRPSIKITGATNNVLTLDTTTIPANKFISIRIKVGLR